MIRGMLTFLFSMSWALTPAPAEGAVLRGLLRPGSTVSVCFVGANTQPVRVLEIMSVVQDFENVSALRFVAVDGRSDWLCPPPLWDMVHRSYVYRGDIRVLIPGRLFEPDGADTFLAPGNVPGTNCPFPNNRGNPGTSWAQFPGQDNPGCMYNLKLNNDGVGEVGHGWRNHTLHEFGHALGLGHEHERADADARCVSGAADPTLTYLSPYDRESVMHDARPHSEFPNCYASDGVHEIAGNYSDRGLSALDAAAIGMLYPTSLTFPNLVGQMTVTSHGIVYLVIPWDSQGLLMSTIARSVQWSVDGRLVATTNQFRMSAAALGPGSHRLGLTVVDLLGRIFAYHGIINVIRDDN